MLSPGDGDPDDFPRHHGRISLSFAGTVGSRGSKPFERLGTPAVLARWLEAAGLAAGTTPTAPLYRRALRLREAIARAVRAVIAGTLPAPEDVALLNAAARRWAPRPALDPHTLTLGSDGRDPVEMALGRLALDAIELLGDGEVRARLRACALDTCGSVFLTPGGRSERRWCSMARCGNRAKVAAFRARAQRTSRTSPRSTS